VKHELIDVTNMNNDHHLTTISGVITTTMGKITVLKNKALFYFTEYYLGIQAII
tara:strand:- start:77723 stop:77884 length:162 start_codon:yes stop_codon:yes gene_type:complete